VSYLIEVDNLWFKYHGQDDYLLKKINLRIAEGEVFAVVGLSGSGKSTLCYCLSGIIPLIYKGDIKGDVYLKGEKTVDLTLPDIAVRLGIVFQNPETQLFSPTVEDEVAFGPENLCLDRDEIEKRIESSLDAVGMNEYRNHNPQKLSGGEKQRIALASVLSLNPDILVFDEATSQLDPSAKKKIKNVIDHMKKDGKTIIMVEHDLNTLDIADRIMMLKEGKLVHFNGEF